LNENRRSELVHGIAVTLFVLVTAAIASAQTATTRVSFAGTVGKSRIGMTLLVASGKITGGHYFYAKDLKDIPLKAGTQGSGVILFDPEGGQFALRFKGNGSEAGKPLDFRNSVGLEGRWMKGDSSYPVMLQMERVSAVPADARWYGSVTSESDSAFEEKVQEFYHAVLDGNRTAAAHFVDFPLRVNYNSTHYTTIHSAAELAARWNQIFTPAFLDALKDSVPHDMFVRNGQAMLGKNGLVWLGAKGAQSINEP
jgi:hypothetical protein